MCTCTTVHAVHVHNRATRGRQDAHLCARFGLEQLELLEHHLVLEDALVPLHDQIHIPQSHVAELGLGGVDLCLFAVERR